MSIALLAIQGKLSLDGDIRKFLPDFPQYQRVITVRNLLNQTSGIREYSHLMLAAGTKFQDAPDEDVYKMLLRQKELNFKPGDEYAYSNSNYFLLAQIVRSASGKSLRDFAEENIFKPLGMVSTGFRNDSTEVIKNRATGYAARQVGGFSVQTAGSYHVGDGGLFTTVDDLILWDQNYYDNKLGGGTKLIAEFVTPGTLNSGQKSDYGFGIDIETYKGLRLFGHDGVYFGFNAAMARFPEQRFSVICLCNQTSIESPRLVRQVADIYLAIEFKQSEAGNKITLPEPKVVQVPETELAAVAGSYFNSASRNFRRLYVKNGKLIYSRGTSESELAPLGKNSFLMLGTPDRVEISFKPSRPGGPLQMITVVNGGEVTMTHDAVESKTYSTPQLAEFAGAYYSNEIEATYDILMPGDKLVLRRKNVDGETPLLAQFADAFSAAGTGSIRFARDAQNHVTGFWLNTGRVRRLRFDRK